MLHKRKSVSEGLVRCDNSCDNSSFWGYKVRSGLTGIRYGQNDLGFGNNMFTARHCQTLPRHCPDECSPRLVAGVGPARTSLAAVLSPLAVNAMTITLFPILMMLLKFSHSAAGYAAFSKFCSILCSDRIYSSLLRERLPVRALFSMPSYSNSARTDIWLDN